MITQKNIPEVYIARGNVPGLNLRQNWIMDIQICFYSMATPKYVLIFY
jgi:hypothetical protein